MKTIDYHEGFLDCIKLVKHVLANKNNSSLEIIDDLQVILQKEDKEHSEEIIVILDDMYKVYNQS